MGEKATEKGGALPPLTLRHGDGVARQSFRARVDARIEQGEAPADAALHTLDDAVRTVNRLYGGEDYG